MGVGLPEDLVACDRLRHRHVRLRDPDPLRALRRRVFTARGRIRLTHRRYRRDAYPIDTSCDCTACAGGFARAYLHHLFAANEILSAILGSIHNVRFYQRLVRDARDAILADDYAAFTQEFLARYQQETDAAETHTLPA